MPTTPDSFGSINFRVLIRGRSQARQGSVSVRHVPWANETIIQLGGRQVTTARLTLYVASQSVLTALKQAVGSQATLTYHEYTGTATLESVDANDWIKSDTQVVQAVFHLDSD